MTPEQFIATWSQNSLSEKGGAQPHFEDLCRMLGVPPPRQSGEYCYEQGLKKTVGGHGFADVWKRGCFAWENKGPEKDLLPALLQLKNYAGALDNPPVLVVCNRERIEIHPCFTGYPSTPRIIGLADIGRPENLKALKCLFSEADIHQLRPLKSNAAITAEAATEFAAVAQAMRTRGIDSQRVAHFLIQCIFCMYAEDEGLLHRGATDDPKIFTNLLKGARDDADKAARRLADLFEAMQKRNGHYGNDDIAWFNGGLFKTIDIPPLTIQDLSALRTAAETLDWRSIEPVIFGTLFERGLNPQARAPLGAHYTDTATIGKIIHPLITEPLTAEWQAALRVMEAGQGKGKRSDAHKAAMAAYQGFLERLRNFRVLDPACGSGNFLYMAMRALKDLEHQAQIDAELMGFGRELNIETGPRNVLGIEINEYAAELARVTVWIGDLHSRFHELWSLRMGTSLEDRPRYTPTTTFETFPFPPGMTPRDTAAGAPVGEHAQAIAEAARELDRLRAQWLNPPEWVEWVSTPEEDAAGFPKRAVAKPGFEAQLKKRTLTNLYNERPSWLRLRHEALDRAVAAAYGWTDYTPEMSDDDILRRLLALNLDRSEASAGAAPGPGGDSSLDDGDQAMAATQADS